MPSRMPAGHIQRVAQTFVAQNKEQARALPDSKGGEPQGQLQTYRTETFTYFTTVGQQLLYSAENWVKLKLTLQTAGPVAVGQRADIEPVLGGAGRTLDTNVEYEVTLARGTRFYIAAETVNRISVTVEPIAWLEQIDVDGRNNTVFLRRAIDAAAALIAGAVDASKPGAIATPTSSSGKTAKQLMAPCPPPSRGLLPRATKIPR